MGRYGSIWLVLALGVSLVGCSGHPSQIAADQRSSAYPTAPSPVSEPTGLDTGRHTYGGQPQQPQQPQKPASGEKPAAEADLDGDGQSEQIYISHGGYLRIIGHDATELFTFHAPGVLSTAKVSVYPIAGQPPLVGIAWMGCPYGYADNVFIAYDRQKQAFVTDRAPGTMMYCGSFSDLGNGRFDVLFRHNELYYHSVRIWQEDHFTNESSDVRLIRIEIDRLPDVLSMLSTADIVNPEVLFGSADLYKQFKSGITGDQRFVNPEYPTPDSVVLQVRVDGQDQGHLVITYVVEAKYKKNILITGVKWS